MGVGENGRRWLYAAGLAACATTLLFIYVNRDGCWLELRGPFALTLLLIPFFWFLMLFAFGARGRIAVGALTLAMIALLPNDSFGRPSFAAEAQAISRLRKLHSALEAARATDARHEYPEVLPRVPTELMFDHGYQFAYVREMSNGSGDYEARATPVHRSCGCVRSFTVTSSGQLHYTMDARAAMPSDPVLP